MDSENRHAPYCCFGVVTGDGGRWQCRDSVAGCWVEALHQGVEVDGSDRYHYGVGGGQIFGSCILIMHLFLTVASNLTIHFFQQIILSNFWLPHCRVLLLNHIVWEQLSLCSQQGSSHEIFSQFIGEKSLPSEIIYSLLSYYSSNYSKK